MYVHLSYFSTFKIMHRLIYTNYFDDHNYDFEIMKHVQISRNVSSF